MKLLRVTLKAQVVANLISRQVLIRELTPARQLLECAERLFNKEGRPRSNGFFYPQQMMGDGRRNHVSVRALINVNPVMPYGVHAEMAVIDTCLSARQGIWVVRIDVTPERQQVTNVPPPHRSAPDDGYSHSASTLTVLGA
jgi:hypothetical protein